MSTNNNIIIMTLSQYHNITQLHPEKQDICRKHGHNQANEHYEQRTCLIVVPPVPQCVADSMYQRIC
jgi:hypothetical protein